jgi:hypothetical protein
VSVTKSFSALNPSAVLHWDRVRNDCRPEYVVAGSKVKYYVNLPKDGNVQRKLSSFNREPDSTARLTDKPKLLAQWHPTRNGSVKLVDVASQTHVKYWWLCNMGSDHEWEASDHYRVSQRSCCLCCKGTQLSVDNSLVAVKPDAAALWVIARNEYGRGDVMAKSKEEYWFDIPKCGSVLRSPRSFGALIQ